VIRLSPTSRCQRRMVRAVRRIEQGEPMGAIDLVDVVRRFGALTAVDEVTLTVEPGEIVGLLGHNGAGKTTLIRLINGLYELHGGAIRVAGFDPLVDGREVRSRTGVLTEVPALEEYLSAVENLQVYAAVQGVPEALANRRIQELIDRLVLGERASVPSRELSAGLKQRIALARALVHDPSILLLDEPTTNMDPVAARTVRDLVSEAAHRDGRTVLLSTHNLVEAETLCDRVAIMRNGRILATGTPVQLRRTFTAGRGAVVECDAEDVARVARVLLPEVVVAPLGATRVELTGPLPVPALVAALVRGGIAVHRVEPLQATLEDLYLHLHAAEDGARNRETVA
jgi:ABC-2 type transport system ATP-binding protein